MVSKHLKYEIKNEIRLQNQKRSEEIIRERKVRNKNVKSTRKKLSSSIHWTTHLVNENENKKYTEDKK